MTARHLRRLFDLHVGTGPNRVEQTRRIHLAKKLLHETGLSVTEIAFAAGYGRVRRFNESFRAMFGRPPSELRRDRQAYEAAPYIKLSIAVRPGTDWSNAPHPIGIDLTDLAPAAEARVVSRWDRGCLIEFREVPLQHLGRALARSRVALALAPGAAVAATSLGPPPYTQRA